MTVCACLFYRLLSNQSVKWSILFEIASERIDINSSSAGISSVYRQFLWFTELHQITENSFYTHLVKFVVISV